MVERSQPVGPSNLLNNMVQVFANTCNTLPPSNLRTPFGARHESTTLCRWGVFHPEKKSKQRLTVEELGVPVLHPKFLQCFCICTHPCKLGTHTGGLTSFHPPLDTTTLAIVMNGMQRVCQILRHDEKILQNLILCLFVLPLTLFRCVLSFSGGWFNRVGLGLGLPFAGLTLTPTQGATQQSVDCESLTPTQGATQQSMD